MIVEGIDLSDTGGEGGVGASEAADDADLVGGVAMVGEDAVVEGDCSDMDDWGREISIPIGVGLRNCRRWVAASACRNLSCLISASTFRSESSSRTRWVSMLRASRSCSMALISSSIITPRSIETLYFDSKSSKDDVVFLACRSKSSFATSISRSLSCKVLFVSRRVVISFCKAFWAVFASALDCLHFDCTTAR